MVHHLVELVGREFVPHVVTSVDHIDDCLTITLSYVDLFIVLLPEISMGVHSTHVVYREGELVHVEFLHFISDGRRDLDVVL